VQAKLANADFMARARPEILAEHEDRKQNFAGEVARLDAALARIA
jgi:valyl-tRNA synthetase